MTAIAEAKTSSNAETAKKYGINESMVRKWRKSEDLLRATSLKNKRTLGGGRPTQDPEMEELLVEYITSLRDQRQQVSMKQIRLKALSLSNHPEFKASNGWIGRFMRRNSLSYRRRTTTAQKLPPDEEAKVQEFVERMRSTRNVEAISPGNAANMDETPVWMDMPSSRTVTRTGERSVCIRTAGNEKKRFTVVLGAYADGRKMKPFIVFKGKRAIPGASSIPGVIVKLSDNGWMNEALTIEWITECYGIFWPDQRLLVWDLFKCHTTPKVIKHLKMVAKSKTAFVPGGMTGKLQPADVSWNRPFKIFYKELYDEWLLNGEHTFTPCGNLRSPSKLLCIQWVKQAWDKVTDEIIIKSFLICGISNAVDGSQDHLIHGYTPRASVSPREETMLEEELSDESDEDPYGEQMWLPNDDLEDV